MPLLNTLLSTAVLAFTLYNIHASPGLGTITIRLSLFAFAAWVFAIYGDGLAEIVGLSSSWSASKYTDPFVLALGWFFLIVFALVTSTLHWRWFG
jgi:hypothetical protein